jgi:Pyruvate/2-oxoacid:ferredoxin oxidoreductase delta subunit
MARHMHIDGEFTFPLAVLGIPIKPGTRRRCKNLREREGIRTWQKGSMISNGCRKALGNRNRKQRSTHAGSTCRTKRNTNPCCSAEPYVFENLEKLTRPTGASKVAREQITHETTERFHSSPPAAMPPAQNPNTARKISRPVAVVEQRRCAVCRVCVDICGQHAISINANVVIDSYHCNGCGSCADACPNEAISLVEI